ncbi:chemotaxis protein methyltransferase CheR [Caldimonas brevitalea]|uniref:histidine kinase n=2 Tax=Caldimonas brevitalea TaxID=413882 RepID=A0A0G3BDK6_9BURK|nr:chemotaxis protein methyltransferase CheR [Caldimonas brevitalea]
MARPPAPPTASFEALAERLLQLFLAQTHEHAVALLDVDGTIVGWRGAAEHVFGYREAEVLGQPISLIFTEEDVERRTDRFERLAASVSGVEEDDRWHVRHDGTRIWLSGTIMALRDERNELVGYGKIMRDRTDLRARIETLEHRIEELEQSHRHKDVFFARLSHEVRNSLAPLRNAAELIRRTQNPAELRFPLSLVQRQLELLGRMAQDLTEVARAAAGKLTLAVERLDLNAQLQLCAEASRAHAEGKQQELQVLLPETSVELQADPERLQQVVFNLLDNAIKYTPEHGRIWLKLAIEGPDAVIRVRDTGRGMGPELLPRVFDLFTQGAPDEAEGGFGVGLSLVKDLVHAHGGTVEVRSEGGGKGSEFTVRLPMREPRPGAV